MKCVITNDERLSAMLGGALTVAAAFGAIIGFACVVLSEHRLGCTVWNAVAVCLWLRSRPWINV